MTILYLQMTKEMTVLGGGIPHKKGSAGTKLTDSLELDKRVFRDDQEASGGKQSDPCLSPYCDLG